MQMFQQEFLFGRILAAAELAEPASTSNKARPPELSQVSQVTKGQNRRTTSRMTTVDEEGDKKRFRV
jgi:hypothetical protein